MLSPSDRCVLTETLRPPAGYEIDRVVGTSYSLDLVALLTLPLSFTLLAGDGVNDEGRIDPIVLLEALRRHAGRITVFCDAGHIAVPRRGELLFGYLEKSVVEATAPLGGAFHPKVTVVRYLPNKRDAWWQDTDYPGDNAAWYRLLCGTRNLTFDRSWDTMLVLDGGLATNRKNAFRRNRPLARFIGALPGMALHELEPSRLAAIARVADELLRVQFQPPAGFGTEVDDLAFWPIGLDETREWPFGCAADRLLVMSPFVDRTCLRRLANEVEIAAAIGRAEELDRLAAGALDGIADCFVLADAAESELTEEDPSLVGSVPIATSATEVVMAEGADAQLRGLHAKLYVADIGWHARVWTGSANATSAAFERNVEFLVELRGKKSAVGIDALLGQEEGPKATGRRVALRSMLVPYRPPVEPVPLDPLQNRLEQRCDEIRGLLVATKLTAMVSAGEAPAPTYGVLIRASTPGPPALPSGIECTIQPVTRLHDPPVAISSLTNTLAAFDRLALESLTSFFAVTVTAREPGGSFTRRFVLSIPLVGAPADRENRLLLAMLSNRERLIRYLLMLLAGPELALHNIQRQSSGDALEEGHSADGFGLPLLEPLLRNVADDSARLEDIERLVRDLESTEEGSRLLPEDFRQVWDAINAVRNPPERAAGNAAQ